MANKPDVNEDDVGAIIFNMRKSQAIEKIMAKIRHHLGDDWYRFRDDEIILLEKMLGECWSNSNFTDWDRLNIAAITYDHIAHIVAIARKMNRSKLPANESLANVRELLKGL